MVSSGDSREDATNPYLRFLNEDQCRKIHETTLELLEKTGVWMDEPECLEMLRAEGARVVDTPSKRGSRFARRVQIPSCLVEEAIRSAPDRVTIYNRRGDVSMVLQDRVSYFGFFGDDADFIDPYTNTRRKMVFDDIEKHTILLDALPHVDWILSVGNCHDADLRYRDRASVEAILRNTTKPVTFCSGSVETVTDVVDMAAAIVGGEDRVRSKPFILCLDEPMSPLLHGPESLKRVFLCADLELPLIYVPMPMAGLTAPCTVAGTVVMGNAESLSGLVVHQLRRRGAPYIYGALASTADMSLGSFNYGAPELSMMCSAVTDMAHYYKLPVWGTGGCSDSNAMDAQAGAEAMMSLLGAVLAGANLVHDIGLFAQGLCISPGFSLLADEMTSMVKRFAGGIEVTDASLCLNLIDEIGPGGNYMSHEHTCQHFRDMWAPRVFDRANIELLEKGYALDSAERAQQRAREIMQTHHPEPIPEGALKDLDEVAGRWHRL